MTARRLIARRSAALPEPFQQKGRGAKSNASGRFEPTVTEPFDDGWSGQDPPARPLRTTLIRDATRSIIATNDSPDIGFNRSINPYRGCEHGCIYCYARPSHAYWGYSAGLDFESVLFYKPDAAALLEAAFRKPSYAPETIVIGANTDPYQPVERQLKITRSLLEVFDRFSHPVGLITKSATVTRDIDVLARLATRNLARVSVSVTTLDRKLARSMEPRAATPERRLEAIRALTGAGIPVTMMTAPIIPGLNDHEIEPLLEAGAEAGADRAAYVLLRLPLEIKDLFKEWLSVERPMAAAKVMSLIRQTRGGKEYDANWRVRQTGEGPVAQLVANRYAKARKRFGLDRERTPMDTALFQRPLGTAEQLSLF
jgi:DNA repair photolyase